MRIVIVNKSDSTGGAAVVSYRLMSALRSIGVDARMLVAEKLTDSEYVETAASPLKLKMTFIADRLRIAIANGFNRTTLFKLDAAFAGINISDHPLVRSADAIFLNWVNQGLLSLGDIRKLGETGKKIVWTMHDMWNMTGLCHHAGDCRRYESPEQCGECPMLGRHSSSRDISCYVHGKKKSLYSAIKIKFVAVSSWLADKAAGSSLLGTEDVSVIPNAFHLPSLQQIVRKENPDSVRLIFGAARLDDDVKGFPVFIEAIDILKRRYPELAARISIILYGSIRNRSLIDKISLPVEYTGLVRDPEAIAELYCRSDIVVSTSLFETLPGTLVEGQAYGCVPVTFGRGGQRDIVEDRETGIIAEWSDDRQKGAERIAEGIAEAAGMLGRDAAGIRKRMYESVKSRFGADNIARRYMQILAETESG